jgi:hypothetical protein
MKIRKITTLLAISLGAIIAFSGCTKDDGAISKRVTVAEVPVVTTPIDPTGSQTINMLNLASFSGKFKVDLYFPGATPPSKVDIVVRKNGSNSNLKIYKTGVTSLPATFTITAADLATLFGAPIVLGDSYDFAPDLYVGDRKYEAFPAVGVGNGAGVIGMPLYSEFARFAAICAYDPEIYQGNFVVVKDLWADMSPGDIVVLTKISATSFSFIYSPAPPGTLFNAKPIVVTVNTATNVPAVALQTVGTGWTYDNSKPVQVQTTTSANNIVKPCDKTISLNLNWTQGAGSYTGAVLQLIKQ